MKLSIAVGILAQTLPVISETTWSSKRLKQGSQRHLDLSRVLLDGIQNTPPLRQGRGTQHTALENPRATGRAAGSIPPPPLENIQICDPFSIDPDVGILSCDTGYACIVEKTSRLGGTCSLTSSGELRSESCDLCGPNRMVTDDTYDIQILWFEEGVTCGQLVDFAYGDSSAYTIHVSDCPAYGKIAQESGCCVSLDEDMDEECNLCGDSMFYPDLLLELPVGQAVSCGYLQQFLNSTWCAAYSHYYVEHCCAPDSAVSISPTPARQELTVTRIVAPFGAPPPTTTTAVPIIAESVAPGADLASGVGGSSVATIWSWSMGNLVSMMVLVAVATTTTAVEMI